MKTLLVLAQHPEASDALNATLNPQNYRLIHRISVQEAEPLLAGGLIDACLINVQSPQMQVLWEIEKIRLIAQRCPILIVAELQPWEWEEEAYLRGVSHVLTKPIRGKVISILLERLWATPSLPASNFVASRPASFSKSNIPPVAASVKSLEVLRDFSSILSHSLRSEALLRQFLIRLREIIAVNRAVVFLRKPETIFKRTGRSGSGRTMHSACAIGLPQGLLEHFELSFETGIGGYLFRHGRILRRESEDASNDMEIQKEFELLGTQVAIPILDRESLIGVASFDGRVTGESLANGELELLFHLLEELGLAIKNIWLHAQLSANHEMMAGILRQLSSACVLVGRDLGVLHANKTAQRLFLRGSRKGSELEFSDLPQTLGSKVFLVLQTGNALATFKYEPPDSPGAVYNVSIVPFNQQPEALPNAALLMAEDLTQARQLEKLQRETENLRLIKNMADRLAHEIGNAMVPLSTHQQLLAERFRDAEFRASLDAAMADGVKRVSRLINQMRYLARDSILSNDAFPLADLIEEAFQEAHLYQPVKSARLKYEQEKCPVILSGDRAALKHAFSEVILNALQANTSDASVDVAMHLSASDDGHQCIQVEVRDKGEGFTAEEAAHLPMPFETTRTVGLGLGLCVCRKIVEMHRGRLEIIPRSEVSSGIVRISLPVPVPGDAGHLS